MSHYCLQILKLSNVSLTTEELELLKYGLKHLIQPLQVNKTDILIKFYLIHRAMAKDLGDEKQSRDVMLLALRLCFGGFE